EKLLVVAPLFHAGNARGTEAQLAVFAVTTEQHDPERSARGVGAPMIRSRRQPELLQGHQATALLGVDQDAVVERARNRGLQDPLLARSLGLRLVQPFERQTDA